MAYSSSFPHKKNSRPQPEVADREPELTSDCPDSLNISLKPTTGELEDLPAFKVFLKKNLPYEAPPENLLANIYDRIDRIKAENAL